MKKTTNLLIRIFFIIIALFFLLGFKNVFGFVVDLNETTYNLPEFPFDIEEHSTYIFGYKKRDNCFIVGYPSDAVKNNKIFCSATDELTDLVFRYYIDGTNKFGQWTWYYINLNNLNAWSDIQSTSPYDFIRFLNTGKLIYSSVDIYEGPASENVFFQATIPFKAPSFSNSIDSFKTNSFKNFIISPGDLSSTDKLEFTIRNDDSYYEIPDTILDGYEEINTFILDNTSPYFKTIQDSSGFYYEIPKSDLTFAINDNNQYTLLLFWDKPELLYKELSFTVGILSDEELLLTDVNNTNKNIFQKIGDIFNLLNPFHENFFGRKLVELIIDGLKGLFIPENEYFSNYFDELNNWFSDRLGFLYYPLDVLFDLFNRFLSLSSDNLVIIIPEIKEPTTDVVLINNQSFDFNTLLENQVLRNLHNIYLILIDAIICFGLVNLLYNKYEEVIAK